MRLDRTAPIWWVLLVAVYLHGLWIIVRAVT